MAQAGSSVALVRQSVTELADAIRHAYEIFDLCQKQLTGAGYATFFSDWFVENPDSGISEAEFLDFMTAAQHYYADGMMVVLDRLRY